MCEKFTARRSGIRKTSPLASIAVASLLLVSAPALIHAQTQAPPPGFPPPGSNGFAQAQPGSGWLGVSISEVTPETAKNLKLPEISGVVIDAVGQNTPAAKAGLQKGDVVAEYNGQLVQGTLQFERFVRETPPGRTANLTVWRGGKPQSISVVIGEASAQNGGAGTYHWRVLPEGPEGYFTPQPNAPALPPNFQGEFQNREETPTLGVSAMDLTGQLGNYFGAPNGQGVLVTDVPTGSAAEKAGLQAGDVITRIDSNPVHNIGELRTQLRANREGVSVTLTVIRKGSEISITVTPEKPQRNDNQDHQPRQ